MANILYFYAIPIFEVMENNLSFGSYMYTCILATNFGLVRLVHSLLSMHGKLTRSNVQKLICKNEFILLLSHEIALNAYVG